MKRVGAAIQLYGNVKNEATAPPDDHISDREVCCATTRTKLGVHRISGSPPNKQTLGSFVSAACHKETDAQKTAGLFDYLVSEGEELNRPIWVAGTSPPRARHGRR
jgi:hypothetical protein